MWETIKKDPLLKTVVVAVLGVLAFGFAFNIMFGSRGSMGMGEGMEMGMGAGSSLMSTMSYTLALLTKLLLIIIIIAVIVIGIKFVEKYVAENKQTTMIQFIKEESSTRVLGVSVLLLIVLGIVSVIIGGTSSGNYYGNNMMLNNQPYLMGSYQYGAGIPSILGTLIKILIFLSLVGLVIALLAYFKENNLSKLLTGKTKEEVCKNCGSEISKHFKHCPECGTSVNNVCQNCGEQIKSNWKCCPNCGHDINGIENDINKELSIDNAKDDKNAQQDEESQKPNKDESRGK